MQLSSPFCTAFNPQDEFPEVLEKQGRLPGEYTIKLKKDAKQVVQTAFRFSLKYKEQQLKSLVRD